MEEMFTTLILVLDSTLRVATPLLLASMAGLFSERSGIIDIGLEGKMLGAAFTGATVAFLANSAFIGLCAGILASMSLSLVHGYACITHRGNQVVSGMAINILVAGLTVVIGSTLFHKGGQTPLLPHEARFLPITLPGAEAAKDIPFIGLIWQELLSGHVIFVYLALAAPAVAAWILYKTRFGLRLRAVGETPAAVDTAGVNVIWLRYRAVLITGFLCGLAGVYLSVGQNAGFLRDMTAGKGYIALAAMVFGRWRPGPAFIACLLFGLLDAIAVRLQGVVLPGIGEVPVQLILAMPYILTVVLLAGFFGRAIAPRALGTPYVKER